MYRHYALRFALILLCVTVVCNAIGAQEDAALNKPFKFCMPKRRRRKLLDFKIIENYFKVPAPVNYRLIVLLEPKQSEEQLEEWVAKLFTQGTDEAKEGLFKKG
jgi:hypothetical protein